MTCRSAMEWTRRILLLLPFAWLLFLTLAPVTDSTQVHYIHWNSSNPIFRIDNTDHIFDVNAGNLPGEYDQANIICPVYKQGTSTEEAEEYIIYNVSKDEYDSCRILDPNPRVIALCNKPSQVMYFTITFRSFTPTPGGMEFRPGQDYYFISTSADDDLNGRQGGRCTTHNMKVMFKVGNHRSNGRRRNRPLGTTSSTSAVNVPRRRKLSTTPSPRSRDFYEGRGSTVQSDLDSSDDVTLLDTNRLGRGGRRTRPSEDSKRDLIKQEASRMQNSLHEDESSESAGASGTVNLLGAGSGAKNVANSVVALVLSLFVCALFSTIV
jgi:hypothetical protein